MPYELYTSLGLDKNATERDIKRAYKKLVLTNHPDKGGDEKKFQKINEAYNTLNDPAKKSEYDRTGQLNQNGGGKPMNPQDIFRQFFNGSPPEFFRTSREQSRPITKCKDITHNLDMTLEDVAKGATKTFKIKIKAYKEDCYVDCHVCYGSGKVQSVKRMGRMTQMTTTNCQRCNGECIILKEGLKENDAKYDKDINVKLDIPKGIQGNHRITMKGNGEQARHKQQVAGDLIFLIHIKPHEQFSREGNNLICHIPISFIDAVCGKMIDINILNIDTICIDTAGVLGILKHNHRYPFQNKGLPIEGVPNKRGDLILIFDIDYPILNEHKRLSLREEMENII